MFEFQYFIGKQVGRRESEENIGWEDVRTVCKVKRTGDKVQKSRHLYTVLQIKKHQDCFYYSCQARQNSRLGNQG